MGNGTPSPPPWPSPNRAPHRNGLPSPLIWSRARLLAGLPPPPSPLSPCLTCLFRLTSLTSRAARVSQGEGGGGDRHSRRGLEDADDEDAQPRHITTWDLMDAIHELKQVRVACAAFIRACVSGQRCVAHVLGTIARVMRGLSTTACARQCSSPLPPNARNRLLHPLGAAACWPLSALGAASHRRSTTSRRRSRPRRRRRCRPTRWICSARCSR